MLQSISIRQWLALALLSVVMLAGYAYLNTHAFVKINVDTDSPARFRLYWKTGEQAQYTEVQSARIQIYPKKHYYTLALGDLRGATHLRISPANNTHLFRITELSIYQSGFTPIRFMGKSLKELIPIQGIAQISFDQKGMVYQPNYWDAYFETAISLQAESDTLWTHLWRLGILIGALFLLVRAYPGMVSNFRYVPVLMLLITGLLTTMALISRPHAHPDEHAHLQAAEYFENHSALPIACAAGTESSYTNYGTSRLNTNELAYYLSGKFLQLTEFIPLHDYLKLRLLNVGLFVLLMLLAVARPSARLVMTPLLISPQIWYVFSYFNSDALAIFSTLLIAYQLTGSNTLFKQLATRSAAYPVLSFAALALLACFLLITKKNFYFFTLFLLGAGAIWLWLNRNTLMSNTTARPAIGLLLVAGLAFGSWTFYQESIHDFERSEKVRACRTETALPAFKPDAPLGEANWSLSFDKRGISIPEMLEKGWAKSVFISAFGNFGYVEHPASRIHYQLVALLLLGLALTLIYGIIRRGDAFQKWLLAGATSLFALLVATTIYKSWTVDYQPQGRYYFAMVPIAGVLFGWLRDIIKPRLFSFFILLLFALGFYFFISVGLLEIRKVGS